jgi:hypothetical protein
MDPIHRRARRLSLLFVVVALAQIAFLVSSRSIQAQLAELFVEPPTRGRLTASASTARDSEAGVVRSRLVRVDLASLGGWGNAGIADPARSVRLNLFPDAVLTAVLDTADDTADGGYFWAGHIHGDDAVSVVFAVRQGMLAGYVSGPGMAYEIRQGGAGLHVIRELDSGFPTGDVLALSTEGIRGAMPAEGAGAAASGPFAAARPSLASIELFDPAPPSFSTAVLGDDISPAPIDLLVVYTPAARQAAGGKVAVEGLIDLGVAEANTAFANSNVSARLRLVHAAEVGYGESLARLAEDVVALRDPADGPLDDVQELRATFAADLVILLRDGTPDGCGTAFMAVQQGHGSAEHAYGVLAQECIGPSFSFTRVIGTILGSNGAPSGPTGLGAFPYSYGYEDAGRALRTIMTRSWPGSSPRVLRFSSPDLALEGRRLGSANQNNAASVELAAPMASAFAKSGDVTPDPPTLISPLGVITDDTPTYIWNEVTGATGYQLWIDGPYPEAGNLWKTWYVASTVCATGTCSVTPALTLPPGVNRWWVRARRFELLGPFSARGEFTVDVPDLPPAATLVSPSGTNSDYTPTFRWNGVTTSTWYHLWVSKLPSTVLVSQWYTAAAVCAGSICELTPPTVLTSGNHRWWVRTWNDNGLGPWSDPMDFNDTPPPPGAPTLISPSPAPSVGPTPTYSWQALGGASSYYLWVSEGGVTVHAQWYDAAAVCSGATCSVTPSGPLAGGAHRWWLRARNISGTGPWSEPKNFWVATGVCPILVELLAPTGTIAAGTPTYRWTVGEGATTYALWIFGPGGATVYLDWYSAAAACGAEECSATPPAPLTPGSYTWWLRPTNASCLLPWYSMPFTVQ